MIKKIIKFILSLIFPEDKSNSYNEEIFNKKESTKALLEEQDKIKKLMREYEETGDLTVLNEIRKKISN
jgi:hypothetical protein